MTGFGRAVVGALGGLAAVVVKILGQNPDYIMGALDLALPALLGSLLGFMLPALGLMFVGGLVSWASEETNKLKLLALGVAAPALITTWTGGASANPSVAIGSLIAPAHAQVGESIAQKEETFGESFGKGFDTFFGVQTQPKIYWVVVGSFKEREDAQALADRVNQETNDPDLNAFVGTLNPATGWWPVITGYGTYSEAQAIKEKALRLQSVTKAFLSPN